MKRSQSVSPGVCSMMKISGSLLSKARIGAMLDGSTVREATVEEYRYLRSCVELYLEFRHMVEFDIYLDEKYIRKIHGVLAGNPLRNTADPIRC